MVFITSLNHCAKSLSVNFLSKVEKLTENDYFGMIVRKFDVRVVRVVELAAQAFKITYVHAFRSTINRCH